MENTALSAHRILPQQHLSCPALELPRQELDSAASIADYLLTHYLFELMLILLIDTAQPTPQSKITNHLNMTKPVRNLANHGSASLSLTTIRAYP
jgi:hypothetical protein